MEENDKRMKEKVEFFYNEKCKVHVKRHDGFFWNGLILSKKSEGVYEFLENKLGKQFLFIRDIRDIDAMREMNK